MSYTMLLHTIGGQGGSPFSLTGRSSGATLKKIGVAVGGSALTAVRLELSDGRKGTYGKGHTFNEFEFQLGERITRLSLWGNGAGTRTGGIKLKTSSGREFSAYMTEWGLKTEYSIDVGSGVCLGVEGNCGGEIDKMGLLFINTIQSSVLTDMTYPSLAMYTPQVQNEYIKSVTYNNDTSEDQQHTCEYSRSVTKSTTWSSTTKIEASVSMSVSAGIPDLAEVSVGYSLTVGAEQTSSMTREETITESDSITVTVPAGKRVTVDVTVGRSVIDLEYSATVKITCKNGSQLSFPSTGRYKGVAYTAVKVNTIEE